MTMQKEKHFIQRVGPGSIFCLQTDSRVSRVAQGRNYRIQMLHELWRPPGYDQDTLALTGKERISFLATFILCLFFLKQYCVGFFKANKKRAGSCGQSMPLA